MHKAVVLGFISPPHTTEVLADQGGTLGFGTGKCCVFPDTVESRGYRKCSVLTLITPK